MANSLRKTLKKAKSLVLDRSYDLPVREKPLPPNYVVSEEEPEKETTTREQKRKAKNYVEVEVTSSKGKKYRLVIPQSYANSIPRVWKWDDQRYRVAEMISEGIPIKDIAETEGLHRTTIYAWLEHPEFREHVDGLTLESGFANRRERIARLNRLTQKLEAKVLRELSGIKLNEKSIGPVLATIGQLAKHLAQEKEEFVEASKVEQQTNVSGNLAVAHVNVEQVLNSKADEERKRLEEEFNRIGDEIIRSITGSEYQASETKETENTGEIE